MQNLANKEQIAMGISIDIHKYLDLEKSVAKAAEGGTVCAPPRITVFKVSSAKAEEFYSLLPNAKEAFEGRLDDFTDFRKLAAFFWSLGAPEGSTRDVSRLTAHLGWQQP